MANDVEQELIDLHMTIQKYIEKKLGKNILLTGWVLNTDFIKSDGTRAGRAITDGDSTWTIRRGLAANLLDWVSYNIAKSNGWLR